MQRRRLGRALVLATALMAIMALRPALADVAIRVNGIDVANDPGTTTSYSGSIPGWSFILTGVSNAPDKLAATSFDIAALGAGPQSLTIGVSGNGDTSTGLLNLLSSFTTNVLAEGWTVDIASWASAGGALFDKATPLASHTFDTIGTYEELDSFLALGDNSYTAEFVINANGSGNATLLTAHIQNVSEPASLVILGGALLSFGLIWRRKRL